MEFHEDCRYFQAGPPPFCTAKVGLATDPVEIDGTTRTCVDCIVYEIASLVDCDHIGNFPIFPGDEDVLPCASDAGITCTRGGGATLTKLSVCRECSDNRL